MKVKVSNYISQFLADYGITHVFSVTGGGAMHLNDAFGHQKGLQCIYNHHEQACAIAGESYSRIHNRLAVVCVTTGPGGTNAITGVVGGWLDSIPMLIISGQVRYDTTARWSGLNIRSMGDQEFDICNAVGCMTKYCEMVIEPLKIKACLQKALHMAQTGRPGPCWLDIPLNVQGAYIETDDLEDWDSSEYDATLPPAVSSVLIKEILEKIRASKRPVLYAGNGIRISGGWKNFLPLVEKLNIPVVTGWDSIDAIHDDHPLYVGRAGIMGDRAGNFAVQNSDLVFSIGNRLSIRQVGYNYKTWAREAFVIANDIDAEELKKPTLHVDMPVWGDAKDLIEKLDSALPNEERLFERKDWLERCASWKVKYPVVQEKHFSQKEVTNVYAFIGALSRRLNEGQVTVVGNGSACVVGSHGYVIKKNQRFIINSAIASMGYDLPAAIGACIADSSQDIINVTGDGSIQMNIQELQTIITNKLPIKIFIINNGGYHSIRQTQNNFFGKPLVGIGPESEDLSFPDMAKLAPAYGYPFFRIHNNDELSLLDEVLSMDGPVICEVMVDSDQKFEPKSATRRLDDGTLVSAPLEDLAPFLSREELAENLLISPVTE